MLDTRPKVLVVDDEAENVSYLHRALSKKYSVSTATSGQQALDAIRQEEFAIIVADQRMPQMTGVQFLTEARRIAPDAIRIMVTAYADLDNTVDAINLAGVSSYVRKPCSAAEIEQTVDNAAELYMLRQKNHQLVETVEERNRQLEEKERLLTLDLDQKSAELVRINRRLEELVVRDGLTGLYNHRYFQERTEQEILRAQRYHLNLSLVFFDLDHFKEYNDLNGHPRGDQALVTVANLLRSGSRRADIVARIRGTDIVARYGGEEFVVLLPETNAAGATIMADRLRVAIEQQPFAGEEKLPDRRLTVSAGIAAFPTDASDRATLISRADQALYRAKAAGRNRIVVFGAETQ